MKREARKWKMWAVKDGDELALWDYRAPITWLRKPAKDDMKKYCFDGTVVRVLVTELPPARKRK